MATLSGPKQFFPAGDTLTRTTDAQATVGSRGESPDGGVYIYVKAGGAITASGDAVGISTNLSAVVTADLGVASFLGVTEAPFASGEYGYVQIKGSVSAVVESGAAAGTLVELSANAAKLKPITTSGAAVGIMLEASDNAGTARKAVYLF